MSSSPLSKTGHQVLKTTGRLNARAADLKQKTMVKLGTYNSIRLTTATRSGIFHGEKDLWPRSRQNKGTLANYLQEGVMKCDGFWYTF